MALPGSPAASVPSDESHVMRRLADLEAQLRELRAADPLRTAGIEVTGPDAVRIVGSLNTTGALDVDGLINVDGTMTVAGDAVFSGDLAVPNGSITNAALQSPVTFDSAYANTSPLNLTASEQIFAAFTLNVPAGYTKAMITVIGSVGVVNPTGAFSSIAARVYLDPPSGPGTWGPRRFQGAQPGGDAAVYSMLVQQYSGITPGLFTFRLGLLNTGVDWGGTPGGGTIDAAIVYTR